VSTDSPEIARIAESLGVEVHARSARRSQDECGTQEVALEVLTDLKVPEDDLACLIYATAPMIHQGDLHLGRSTLRYRSEAQFAFSVGTAPLRDAGQFYWGRVSAFVDMHPLIGLASVMIPIAEDRVCDINTEEDWVRAEAMYAKLNQKGQP
jgi:pseudaminic acid cytidylyltransferase